MSNKLLIFIGPNQAFDVQCADRAIVTLPDWTMKVLGPGIGAVQQYQAMKERDELTVRISLDAETITIDGHLDERSATLALAIQHALSSPLRITDMSYSFDLLLGEFVSTEELLLAASG